MTVLTDVVTKVEASLAAAKEVQAQVGVVIDGHNGLLAELKAEAAKVPTIDDVRALLDQMAAGQAKT